ncbi:MAG: hypothetical protein KF797_08830 [Flavobacteriales bacterium]|nr:hypothetical protein [Flavobacteriales bacterium]
MRAISHLPLLSLLLLTACTDQGGKLANAQTAGGTKAAQNWQEGRDYTVLERVRIMDNMGFQQPAEAFSVLIPKGWKYEGGVVWKSLQECRSEMVGTKVRITSPDGAIVFQGLQPHSWSAASDPMMMQNLQMQAAQGGCAVGGTMSAEEYLRQVFLPNELRGATVTEVERNPGAEQEMSAQAGRYQAEAQRNGGRAELMPSAITVRVKWGDGTEGIVLLSVNNLMNYWQNPYTGVVQQISMSTASERSWVRFPAARRTEAEAFLANLKSSIRTNPAWKQAVDGYFAELSRQQDRQHHIAMAAIDQNTRAMTAAHNQRMADIQAQGAANTARHNERMAAMDNSMRSWEQQQTAQDRQHTRFVQAIREVETWQGSGGAVELSSGYDQAWSRGDGTYIMSNKPGFDPAAVFQDQSWTEMKRRDP